MCNDVYKLIEETQVKKPSGDVLVVYFSSFSNNTHRFVLKTGLRALRIPIDLDEELNVNEDYVLFCPTYSGGGNETKGAVPKQVIQFLNNKNNRDHCFGVIPSGNTNFNDTYCLAGPVISQKLNVPILYQYELLGTKYDVDNVKNILNKFWGKNE
ncbi:class Ib ribonucleoside-diphosphate reductase assembly flavoprotein NrdI [Ureaplasma sp. ES3154-GEN]|uniref:class Ib ribonucleoside-diphosphate reductase assembly flavoprotein NrdI n=1 Tax=Ureaplasma sp. ES3154-GEN TaxID=2984844 RepID=UPI0021E87398|nr:class Ib ribonucleoside-diphosphate reductase assembly flavoprotein NrdI [Ureaplasma sp. ES3154-GEN]MCV3743399.1 class Ib ribonucleoside-diphosphate reductase assembly flavoprotein NrdI [Ureaplasma sp. ES3154-GEN]